MRKFLLTLTVVGAALALGAPSEAASVQTTIVPAVFHPTTAAAAQDLVQPVQYYRHHRRYYHRRHYRHY